MRLASGIYAGRVSHTRLRPVAHDFEYRVFYLMLDLDELASLDRRMRVFSVGRRNLLRFEPSDHGPADGSDLKAWAEDMFQKAGVRLDGGSVHLLAMPRILGYVFNPLSVWYGYDADGVLRGVIHEVRNTFGDRHVYVVAVDPDDLDHSFQKQMHVSPFNDLDQSYRFTINAPGHRLGLAINHADREGVFFRAGVRLTRSDITDRQLIRHFLQHPALTVKVIVGIHYQALKLWLKGAKYHRRPRPPIDTITVMGLTASR